MTFRKGGLTKEQLFKLRDTYWDITPLFRGEPPIPKWTVKCPQCGSTIVCIKHYLLHEPHYGEYRVDVWFKCMACGMVWVHGLHLTKQEYEQARRLGTMRNWTNYGHICQTE